MIKVDVKKLSNYPVSSVKVKKALQETLEKQGLKSNAYISVAIVGEKKMMEIAQTYLNEKNVVHNVLTFTSSETRGVFASPTNDITDLGEIIVCFTKAKEEANVEGKLVEDKVLELVEHGAKHLMGYHHE